MPIPWSLRIHYFGNLMCLLNAKHQTVKAELEKGDPKAILRDTGAAGREPEFLRLIRKIANGSALSKYKMNTPWPLRLYVCRLPNTLPNLAKDIVITPSTMFIPVSLLRINKIIKGASDIEDENSPLPTLNQGVLAGKYNDRRDILVDYCLCPTDHFITDGDKTEVERLFAADMAERHAAFNKYAIEEEGLPGYALPLDLPIVAFGPAQNDRKKLDQTMLSALSDSSLELRIGTIPPDEAEFGEWPCGGF